MHTTSALLACFCLALSTLVAPTAAQLATTRSNGVVARYWPTKSQEVEVEIDGYDFDFEAAKRGRGYVDGPFTHNGKYRILKNCHGEFHMAAQVGNDSAQRNDLDIVLKIKRGTAQVTGSVKGRKIGTIQTPVTRSKGYFVLEFKVQRSSGRCSRHVIRWRG